MPFRFLAPLADGTLADVTVEAITLQAAFERFKASPRPPGWYAVWCGLRLAGHVRVDEERARAHRPEDRAAQPREPVRLRGLSRHRPSARRLTLA